MGRGEPSYTSGGNVNWCSHYGDPVQRFLKNLKTELTCAPAIPLLDISLEKNAVWKDTCTPKLSATLLTVASETSIHEEWTKTVWCADWNITQPWRRMRYCHSPKLGRTSRLSHRHKWTKSEEDRCHMRSFICGIIKDTNELTKQKYDSQAWKTSLWLSKGREGRDKLEVWD